MLCAMQCALHRRAAGQDAMQHAGPEGGAAAASSPAPSCAAESGRVTYVRNSVSIHSSRLSAAPTVLNQLMCCFDAPLWLTKDMEKARVFSSCWCV